jgi:hypothetical protein
MSIKQYNKYNFYKSVIKSSKDIEKDIRDEDSEVIINDIRLIKFLYEKDKNFCEKYMNKFELIEPQKTYYKALKNKNHYKIYHGSVSDILLDNNIDTNIASYFVTRNNYYCYVVLDFFKIYIEKGYPIIINKLDSRYRKTTKFTTIFHLIFSIYDPGLTDSKIIVRDNIPEKEDLVRFGVTPLLIFLMRKSYRKHSEFVSYLLSCYKIDELDKLDFSGIDKKYYGASFDKFTFYIFSKGTKFCPEIVQIIGEYF